MRKTEHLDKIAASIFFFYVTVCYAKNFLSLRRRSTNLNLVRATIMLFWTQW
jgi:hypothetical protein